MDENPTWSEEASTTFIDYGRYFDPDFDKPSRLVNQLNWLAAAGFTAVDVYWLRAGHAVFGGYKKGD